MEIWIWTIFSFVILVWYIIVTIKVTFKGGDDVMDLIKKMKKDSK